MLRLHYTIWSQYGHLCSPARNELPALVDASAEVIDAAIAARGFALTWCDVEPVVVLDDYPEGELPAEATEWLQQSRE